MKTARSTSKLPIGVIDEIRVVITPNGTLNVIIQRTRFRLIVKPMFQKVDLTDAATPRLRAGTAAMQRLAFGARKTLTPSPNKTM